MENDRKKIRFGILSTANIAVRKVIPAIQQSTDASVDAIASRNKERAEEAAHTLGIDRSFSSYETLINDPEIDAIYIPLPNHLHIPWTVQSLEAGKHVLCEKPLGLTTREIDWLIDESRRYPDLHVREAFMYRYHPRWIRTVQLIRSGKIGRLKTIHSHFSYRNEDPENIRNKPGMGGGGVMDIGCYSIAVSRLLFGRLPAQVSSVIDVDPRFKVDRFASVLLDFGAGSSLFTCGTQMQRDQFVKIWGEKGIIRMEMPFNPPTDVSTYLHVETDDDREEIRFDPCNQFTLQADDFSQAILKRQNRTGEWLLDARGNMAIIEKVLEN